MKRILRSAVSLLLCAAVALGGTACGRSKLPTTITIWTYYNGDQLECFNQLVEQFNSILEYFHQLDLVDTEGVEPTYRVVDLANIFREDIARGSLTQDEALFNAPRRENGYFKSPRIV